MTEKDTLLQESGPECLPEQPTQEASSPAQAEPSEEATPRSLEETQRIIEAILFAAGYPVSYEKLAEVLEITPGAVKKTVQAYQQIYNEASAVRGVELLLFDTACQLCTKPCYEAEIKKALGIRRGGGLSNSSLEVLAIVAYHQPVTRLYIEQVRGVDSSYHVGSLMDKGLIEAKGRLDVPGRPMLYGTTKDFLRCFGISSLSELPSVDLFGVPEEGEQLAFDTDGEEAQTDSASEGEVSALTEATEVAEAEVHEATSAKTSTETELEVAEEQPL